MATHKITVKASDLVRVLHNVIPMAMADGTDSGIPALEAIRLELDTAGKLTAVTTDRHVMAIDTLEPVELNGTDTFGVTLHLVDAKAIVKSLKADKLKPHVELTLTIEESNAPESVGNTLKIDRYGDYVMGPFVLVEHAYPRWQSLVEPIGKRETMITELVAFNPCKLGLFSHVNRVNGKRDREPVMTLELGASYTHGRRAYQPAAVTIGDTFRGLIMPIRLPD